MIAAIIQARMGSTRLPGKVMKKVVEKPLLGHIIERLKQSKNLEKIIVATTSNPNDKPIVEFCKKNKIDYFIGSEEDVLDRYYQAAKKFRVNPIARLTADEPLIDPVVVDKIIDYFLQNKDKLDFVSNTLRRTYPVGLDVEIFSFKTLEKAWLEAKSKFDREHVTPYIGANPDKFRLANVENDQDLSSLIWAVDYSEDLKVIKIIFKNLYRGGEIFLMDNVLKLLKEKPEIAEINKNVMRVDKLEVVRRKMNVNVMEMFKLDGKVAIVTGATGQLGYQFSAALLEAGANAVLADKISIPREKLENLKSIGPEVMAINMDVTQKNSIKNIVKKVVSKFGRIDILVNNAGFAVFTPFEKRSLDEFEKVINVNLKGVFLCSQIVGKQMIKQKSGNMINIGSTYGIVSPDHRIYGKSGRNSSEVYGASKAGVIQITKYLATHLSKYNIRVNCITPGGVFNYQDSEFVKKYSYKTPLGRMANETELKGAVVFLASDASAYVTGHNLVVDGGWTIW